MKITKARLKQIIKEEINALKEQEDDEDPLVRQALGPAPGMGPEVPVVARPEIHDFDDEARAEEKPEPLTFQQPAVFDFLKSNRSNLKNAKARMRRARAAVRAELKKPENKGKSIYDLPKTAGSPRLEFARAYTALKKAKAGKPTAKARKEKGLSASEKSRRVKQAYKKAVADVKAVPGAEKELATANIAMAKEKSDAELARQAIAKQAKLGTGMPSGDYSDATAQGKIALKKPTKAKNPAVGATTTKKVEKVPGGRKETTVTQGSKSVVDLNPGERSVYDKLKKQYFSAVGRASSLAKATRTAGREAQEALAQSGGDMNKYRKIMTKKIKDIKAKK